MKVRLLFIIFLLSSYFTAHAQGANNINGVYKYQGTINGKIPVFMWFTLQDSLLKGEVVYLRTGNHQPITIAGYISKQYGLSIYEFMKNGNITGIYGGNFSKNGLSGTWMSPTKADKELKYSFTKKDTVLNNKDIDLNPTAAQGEYTYKFGPKGASGVIDLKNNGQSNYVMSIECVTDAPAYNQAEVEATKVKMRDNTILYATDPEFGGCHFRIKVLKNFIVISLVSGDESGDCGFGHNATIAGVFLKTSDKAIIVADRR